jgi:hypothetical protein
MSLAAASPDDLAAELARLERAAARAREAYWDAKTHHQSLIASQEAEEARQAVKRYREEHSL